MGERTMSEKAGSHKELARYLAVWDSWQDQMKGIKWMEDKAKEYDEKIQFIQQNSVDPNSFNICQGIKEAQQVVINGRKSLRWCEVNAYYAGDLGSKENALFMHFMGCLKRV